MKTGVSGASVLKATERRDEIPCATKLEAHESSLWVESKPEELAADGRR